MRSRPTRETDRPRRRALRLTAALLLLAGLLAACDRQDDRWEDIAASGTLRVGVDPTFPPFAVDEGGDLRGLDVDMARAIGRDLGLDVQFSYFGYDGLYDALATGQVDVLISALVVAPERTADFAYTDAYYDAGQILIVREGSRITGMDDLAGQTLAVELGAQGHVAALESQHELPGLTVTPYRSVDEALDALAAGQVDAALVDSVGGRLYLRDHPAARLNLTPSPVVSEPYAMAVRIGDRTLLGKLNEALARLRDSGDLERMTSVWLGR